jgi:hypothetical protein
VHGTEINSLWSNWFAHVSAELWAEKSPRKRIAQWGYAPLPPTVKRQIFYERVGKIKEIKLGWEYQKYENITIIDEVTDTSVQFRDVTKFRVY